LIAILDYGSGNLRSALRAFETTGREVTLTSDPEIAAKASALVVPGVGAFASCMNGLKSVNGDSVIRERFKAGKPTLGICIGMQILFQTGLEHGNFAGVGVVGGEVAKLKAPVLPHMGWNTVRIEGQSRLFKGVEQESFYFVHSYAAPAKQVGQVSAYTDYHGEFLASFEFDSLAATQFHPEKSGPAGLKLIKNWVESL
jgi:glutamine amidotransferase